MACEAVGEAQRRIWDSCRRSVSGSVRASVLEGDTVVSGLKLETGNLKLEK